MIQMPEAHNIVHAWLIDVSNTNHLDGTEVFDNLKDRIKEGKVVWEQAAKDLAPTLKDQQRMLSLNVKYQTICDLERNASDLYLFWANKHVVNLATDPDVDGTAGD